MSERLVKMLEEVVSQYEFAVKEYLSADDAETVETAFTILFRRFRKVE